MDESSVSATQPYRVLDEGIQHRREIECRAADDLEDLARRGLLLQRLADLGMGVRQRLVLILQLREQPHILNGDDRLVDEGLEQLHVIVREGGDVRRVHSEGAYRVLFLDPAELAGPNSIHWDVNGR